MKSGEQSLEHLDLLNKIIEAEQQASLISSAAKQKRDDLPNELRRKQDSLRAEYMERAEKRIFLVQNQVDGEIEEQLARLSETLTKNKKALTDFFAAHHDRLADELFRLVVSPEC